MASTVSIAEYLIPMLFVALPGTAPVPLSVLGGRSIEPIHLVSGTAPQGALTSLATDGNAVEPKPLTQMLIAAPWIEEAGDRVIAYSRVDDGWRGEGSVAPSAEAIADAIDLIEQFAFEAPSIPQPMISADDEGVICLYWRDREMMASLSVYGDDTYSYYAEGYAEPVRADAALIGDPIPHQLLSAMVDPEAVYTTAT